jgi:iron-sulfur cluster assembly accessory protein
MIKEINFSKKAVERINQLIEKKPSGTFFRIAVKGGGCSGFKYDFTFDSKINNDDLKHQNIVVDKSSLDMLKGSEVDFSEELIGTLLKYQIQKRNLLVVVVFPFRFNENKFLECKFGKS